MRLLEYNELKMVLGGKRHHHHSSVNNFPSDVNAVVSGVNSVVNNVANDGVSLINAAANAGNSLINDVTNIVKGSNFANQVSSLLSSLVSKISVS